MRVLETAAHFHFHFMDQRLGVANLRLDFARVTQERPKFAGPPSDKRRLVLALEVVPPEARPFQPRFCPRAFARRGLAQRFLLDRNDSPIG
jgi:hypothetical protein